MLPHGNGYLDTRTYPTQGESDWLSMLLPWGLDLLPKCVQREGLPGWEPVEHSIGFALMLPSTSRMARQWGPFNGLLDGSNHTSLGLVETS